MADIGSNEYKYPIGHVFLARGGKKYTVTGMLGRGGQGEVYRVTASDGEFAVKWYHKEKFLDKLDANAPQASTAFYDNLARNAENGVPKLSDGSAATDFVWPLKMVNKADGSFGYVMDLFPEGYEPFKNVIRMRKKLSDGHMAELHWKSWAVQVRAALNIVKAFEILHASGLSYQDLNEGGLMVNMETGDVKICDCDNVSPDLENLGILGVVTYMAPEVVRRETRPNRHTDEYSLAILLFRMFMHDHPMHGTESVSLFNSGTMTNDEINMQIYGKEPHYSLSVANPVNHPDMSKHADVCKLSMVYPAVLMKAFEQTFTEGVTDPGARLTATEWRKVLLQTMDLLLEENGHEQFYERFIEKKLPAACRTLVYPSGRKTLCLPGKQLYTCHLNEYSRDYETAVGEIIATNKPGVIGFHNMTDAPLEFAMGDKKGLCPPDGRIPLLPGMVLRSGQTHIRVD